MTFPLRAPNIRDHLPAFKRLLHTLIFWKVSKDRTQKEHTLTYTQTHTAMKIKATSQKPIGIEGRKREKNIIMEKLRKDLVSNKFI